MKNSKWTNSHNRDQNRYAIKQQQDNGNASLKHRGWKIYFSLKDWYVENVFYATRQLDWTNSETIGPFKTSFDTMKAIDLHMLLIKASDQHGIEVDI